MVFLSDSVGVEVAKSIAVAKKGFVAAVARFDQAAKDETQQDEAYIALAEAVNWLDSLAAGTDLVGNADIQGILFARHRVHHQWASIAYFDAALRALVWRASTQLPCPADPKHAGTKLRPFYDQHLAGQPVLDVFRRVAPLVAAAR